MKANRGVLMALGRDAWSCLLFDFVSQRVSREINLRVCCGWVQFISMAPAVETMLHPLQRSMEKPRSARSFEGKLVPIIGKACTHGQSAGFGERSQFVAAAATAAAASNDDSEFA